MLCACSSKFGFYVTNAIDLEVLQFYNRSLKVREGDEAIFVNYLNKKHDRCQSREV